MRLVVFLVILCSLLTRSNACIYASSYSGGTIHATTPHKHSSSNNQFNRKGQESIVLEDCSSNSDSETVISDDDVEDEDVANLATPKCRWPAQRHSIYSFIACLHACAFTDTHCSYYNTTAYSLGQLSEKYILQGVLRI